MPQIIPKTKTPDSVNLSLIITFAVLLIILISLLKIWGAVILFLVISFSTPLFFEGGVPAYNALILINSITGGMRVVFPGLNPKLPWENAQTEGNKKKYIDLTVELEEPCKETYASKDALMEVEYVYTIRPDISECNGEDAGEKILRYSSFQPNTIKKKGHALFSMMLSDHYALNIGDDLLQKNLINIAVFGTEENPHESIIKFKQRHGSEATIRLIDSDFNKETQKFRDMISAAHSFDEAVRKLIDGGMERPQAEKIVKLMNLDGYKETDFNLNVDAPHLTNVRDITVLGGSGFSGKGGSK